MVGIVASIIIIILIGALLILEKAFEDTNYYKKNYTETHKLKGNSKVDFVNTGSTFAYYGVDYESVGVKGLNLALCPQSLEDDFKMLQHFEYRYNPNTTVFIVIADLAFAKKGYTEKKELEKYYTVLARGELKEYNLLRAIRAKYLPVLYSWKNSLRFCRDIKPYREYDVAVNENDREAVKADAFKRINAWKTEFSLSDLRDGTQADRFEDTFKYTEEVVSSMMDWCMERNYNPIIVNLPVSSDLADEFSQEFLNRFYYCHIESIVSRYGVKFVDFQKNQKLSDYLLYLDSGRLNKAGREIITKLILDELNVWN